MDSIYLVDNSLTADGVDRMLTDAGIGDFPSRYVECDRALFIVEVAKLAPDNDSYFPLGKWATIQAMEQRIARELATVRWAAEQEGA